MRVLEGGMILLQTKRKLESEAILMEDQTTTLRIMRTSVPTKLISNSLSHMSQTMSVLRIEEK